MKLTIVNKYIIEPLKWDKLTFQFRIFVCIGK